MTSFFINPAARRDGTFRGLFTADEYRDVREYFSSRPALRATPLRDLRTAARRLGLSQVHAKDETGRFDLNAFKIVGAGYAVHRLGDAATISGLVCATAGNHGRALARIASGRHRGIAGLAVPCHVFVPAAGGTGPIAGATRQARVDAMRADGATVVEVDGTYEDAVRHAAEFGRRTGATIVSDTSWDGYERVPRLIMAGYTHVFEEASSQWDEPPTLAIVQGGVGGLVCAAVSWFAWQYGRRRPYIIAAEPENAACLMASARAGRPERLDGSLDTIMSGLRCAQPSAVAWPAIAEGVDAFVTVGDEESVEAMTEMATAPAAQRIDAGPSGACGMAALRALVTAPQLAELRSAAGLDRRTRALVIVTEGP